ncbi:MAG: RluA family pseudouridine synthase [Clostridia bacterium]|nr:RluA family pseudouridine synthase [Clostridia bacterium]
MRIVEHVVTALEAGRTVKSIALKEMRLSRSQFSHLKFAGGIRADGKRVHADERLSAGQRLTAQINETEGKQGLTPYAMPLRMVYEDEDYFVIDKPAPLPTLCSSHQEGPTLENVLYAHLGCPGNFLFRPVNRLDKGTSGLMAAAKNAHAQQLLQRQLHSDAFVREYLAVCRGRMPQASGVIDRPIGKSASGVKREIRPDGQRAVTHYQVEREGKGLSLVRLRLETGRTHQIRVHLSSLGCPIVGDYVYGAADTRLPGRFALHACRVDFLHPVSGTWVRVESPLPKELFDLWSQT